jgi:hypothetical protein
VSTSAPSPAKRRAPPSESNSKNSGKRSSSKFIGGTVARDRVTRRAVRQNTRMSRPLFAAKPQERSLFSRSNFRVTSERLLRGLAPRRHLARLYERRALEGSGGAPNGPRAPLLPWLPFSTQPHGRKQGLVRFAPDTARGTNQPSLELFPTQPPAALDAARGGMGTIPTEPPGAANPKLESTC